MNVRLFVVIFIMFESCWIFAQNRIQFTTEIAQSFRYIVITTPSPTLPLLKKTRNNIEKPKTVISYALEYGYSPHKNITIFSGIGYTGFGYWHIDAKADDLRWPSQIINPGAGTPDSVDYKSGGELKYFSVPLALMYENKFSNKFSVFLRGGIGFDMFFKGKSIVIKNNDRETSYIKDSNDTYRNINLHSDLRVGVGYNFHKNMILQLAYHYKSQIFSSNKKGNLYDYMYNHGFSVSWVWQFSKNKKIF